MRVAEFVTNSAVYEESKNTHTHNIQSHMEHTHTHIHAHTHPHTHTHTMQSATNGFSGYMKIAYCSSAKGLYSSSGKSI